MISIIVLSYNDAKYAKDCIQSIKEKTIEPHNVILVNNGCDVENTKILEFIEDVDYYLREEKNLGLPNGYNIGIKKAIEIGSDFVCLMNADTKVETHGWLTNMIDVFTENFDAGMVAAMTNKIANKKQNWDSYGKKLPKKIIEANWVGLGMTLIPVKVIEEVGLLDEKMTPGAGVDVEYSLRLHKAGYRMFVDGYTYVWHEGKVSFNQLSIPYKDLQKRNIPYIKEKYPNTWRRGLK